MYPIIVLLFFVYVDINECTTNDLGTVNQCSQLCINTEGSYMCQCQSGYRVSEDQRSCDGKKPC